MLKTQCEKLVIQRRYMADIQMIWMLQYRFERRYGKMPFAQVNHPKYRAAYDFMLLRSQNGEVPVEVVEWWKNFYEADEAGRHEMIEQAEKEARGAGSKKRSRRPRKDPTSGDLALNPVPGQGPKPRDEEDEEESHSGRGRRRGRRRPAAPEAPIGFFVPAPSDRKLTPQKRPPRRAQRDPDIQEG